MTLQHTALTAAHKKIGAKMCPFAGYDMPIQYPLGILQEHHWVREKAGIFDVSHMGQVMLEGAGSAALLSQLTPSNIAALPVGKCQYTVLTNEQGGIIDDLIISRLGEEAFFIVVNAARKDVDLPWMQKHLQGQTLNYWDGQALIALQGPMAEAVLKPLVQVGDIAALTFMHIGRFTLEGVGETLVSRTGYTGEDGFEISVPAEKAEAFWHRLLSHEAVEAIGLGARDSLRLEMGFPLYGHDLDESTSPVEAGIGWVVSKDHSGFYGHARILREKAEGVSRKRIGLVLEERGVIREGAPVTLADGTEVGVLCSGGFAPTLKNAIGMAYLPTEVLDKNPDLRINLRGKLLQARVVKYPFIVPPSKVKQAA